MVTLLVAGRLPARKAGTMAKTIKVTLDQRDYDRFGDVAEDMNITTFSILAKKFVLDGIQKYRQGHPDVVAKEINREAEQEDQPAAA